MRAVSWLLGGHPLLGALLVSHVAFFGSLLVLYDLTTREFSEPVARRAIVYIAIFPTAFFFFAPYSESLFLLLSLVAFREARLGRWAGAALAGALAALTRSLGIVLAPALIVMALEQRRDDAPLWPKLVAAVAVFLGPLAYLGWWSVAHSDALAPIHAQANWQREAAIPTTTLWNAAKLAFGVGVPTRTTGSSTSSSSESRSSPSSLALDVSRSRTWCTRSGACSSRSRIRSRPARSCPCHASWR